MKDPQSVEVDIFGIGNIDNPEGGNCDIPYVRRPPPTTPPPPPSNETIPPSNETPPVYPDNCTREIMEQSPYDTFTSDSWFTLENEEVTTSELTVDSSVRSRKEFVGTGSELRNFVVEFGTRFYST
jgi:hypothetical protein